MSERRVWLARLPEMRLAYLEATVTPGRDDITSVLAALWEDFNAWRLRSRPALGRIDISALAWALPGKDGSVAYRVCLPIRSDYKPPEPARTALFPGGSFAYVYADNFDEVAEAGALVEAWIDERDFEATSGPIEVHKYHYNLDQHPCDCGYLVVDSNGRDPVPAGGSHASPLPIAR